MTTEHFIKVREMGFPEGCREWGPLEIDVRYSEWRAQRRTRRQAAAVMVLTAVLVAVWAWGVWG
jgi:hypothetical protein